MTTTDRNHLCPGHVAKVVVDRLALEDAAIWLGNIEDWLLHADPDHATEFAGFLGHSQGRADLAAAALVGDIGAIAATLHHLLTRDPDTEKRTI